MVRGALVPPIDPQWEAVPGPMDAKLMGGNARNRVCHSESTFGDAMGEVIEAIESLYIPVRPT